MSPGGPRRSDPPAASSASAAPPPPRRLAALALMLGAAFARADRVPFGYQSGDSTPGDPSKSSPSDPPDRDSYPGAMRYDPRAKLIYITGGTYGPYFDAANTGGTGGLLGPTVVEADCFLAALKVPDGGDGDGNPATKPGGVRNLIGQFSPRSMLSTEQASPDQSSQLGLVHSFRIGTVERPETCSSLSPFPLGDASAADGDLKARLALVGHTLEGGYLTGLREIGGKKATGYGYALDVELDLTGAAASSPGAPGGTHRIVGGRLFHSSKVQYPVAVAVPPPSGDGEATAGSERDAMYVAVLDTDDDTVNPYHDYSDGSTPDLTAGADPHLEDGAWDDGAGAWHRYGESFDVTILKLGRKTEAEIDRDEERVDRAGGPHYRPKESMKVLWEQPFATAEEGADGSHPGVLLADLVYVPRAEESGGLVREDFLLMAGSTKGYGSAFGSEVRIDGDWDGFLTKLDPATGEELVPPAGPDGALRHPHSLRIRSENGMDDIVRGVCIQPDRGDVRSAYVVGSTRGIFDVESLPGGRDANNDPMEPLPASSAWIAMVDLDTMVVRWKRQFTSEKGMVGTGCAVTPDGNVVYLAGTVSDGGVVEHKSLPKTRSRGKDDVFVAKLDAAAGDAEWFEQTGTAEDEWLAKGGGIVAADEDGGAVLYGGTRGSLMRWMGGGARGRDDGGGGGGGGEGRADERGPAAAADVFVMSVSKDGRFPPSQEGLAHADDGGGPGGAGGDAPNFPDQPGGNRDKGEAIGMSSGDSRGTSLSDLGFFLLAAAAVVVALLLLVSAYRIGRSRTGRAGYGAGREISHENVAHHLRHFDEVDIAIRPSATGGWHGTYDLGDERGHLAAGSGKVPDEITASLSQISRDGTAGGGGFGFGSGGFGSDASVRSQLSDGDDGGGSDASVRSGGGGDGLSGGGASARSVHSRSAHSGGGASVSHSSVVKDADFFEDDEVTAPSARGRLHHASFTIDDNDGESDDDVMDGDESGPDAPRGAGHEGLVESSGGGGPAAMPGGGEGRYGEEEEAGGDPKLEEIL